MHTKKTTVQELNSYSTHTFSNGASTGKDYREFESFYRKYLNEIAKEIGAEVIKFISGHYYFSTFIKRNDSVIYLSISDVRYSVNEWRDNILVRKAKDELDYVGGRNTYTDLINLKSHLDKTLD